MANINVEVLIGENELYTITVSPDEHKEILEGSKLIINNYLNITYKINY